MQVSYPFSRDQCQNPLTACFQGYWRVEQVFWGKPGPVNVGSLPLVVDSAHHPGLPRGPPLSSLPAVRVQSGHVDHPMEWIPGERQPRVPDRPLFGPMEYLTLVGGDLRQHLSDMLGGTAPFFWSVIAPLVLVAFWLGGLYGLWETWFRRSDDVDGASGPVFKTLFSLFLATLVVCSGAALEHLVLGDGHFHSRIWEDWWTWSAASSQLGLSIPPCAYLKRRTSME